MILRFRTGERQDFAVPADRDDPVAADGNRVGLRQLGIAGPNALKMKDRVRRPVDLPTQGATGKFIRVIAVHDRMNAFNKDMNHPRRIPFRVVESRLVAKRFGVEHDDVGDRADADRAAINQAEICPGSVVIEAIAISKGKTCSSSA